MLTLYSIQVLVLSRPTSTVSRVCTLYWSLYLTVRGLVESWTKHGDIQVRSGSVQSGIISRRLVVSWYVLVLVPITNKHQQLLVAVRTQQSAGMIVS